MNNTLNSDFYFYYLILSLILLGMLAAYLYWQGGRFLIDLFREDEGFARRGNSMLLVAFILFNMGYVFLSAAPNIDIVSGEQLFEKLVHRMGVFVIILAVEHSFVLLSLYVMRKRQVGNNRINNVPTDILGGEM